MIPEETKALMQEYEVKSFMSAPMFYAGEPVGVLVLDSVKSLREYTEEEKNLLETIANQSSVVINQVALTEKIQETSEREQFLREVINNILLSENLENAMTLICAEIGILFDAERVKIRTYNPVKNVFSKVVSEYRKNDQIPSLLNNNPNTEEVSEYILKIFSKKNEYFIVEEIENSLLPDYMKDFCNSVSTKSIIDAPVFYKDQLLASIIIENTTGPKVWEKKNIDLLNPVCQQIAVGINLFTLVEDREKILKNERTLKEIISDVSMFDTYKEVDDYILKKLLTIFEVERAVHFHYVENSVYIDSEKTSDENTESLISTWHFSKTHIQEILTDPGQFVTVNDVESEIKNEDLKAYFRSQKINSCIFYPTVKIITPESNKIIEITMLASSINKSWSENEKIMLKLIVDAVSAISLKILEKLKTEEIKRTFTATLTHDLRSPIIAEQKALEAMILGKITCSSEHYTEYLEDIHKTNEDLLKIVNNLLSVYHYESGKPPLNKTEINIKELIQESVKTLKYLAAEKDSQINIDIPDELPVIHADKEEIGRIIFNLVGNAIRHTREGTEIQVSALREDNNIKISVKDNGEGIPKEHIPLMFQRFPTEKRKVGTGLGLYLSKQIVEAHDGKIWFETEEGKGTTFYFTLPLTESRQHQ
ncbi:MAG: ATP-binding protein [bacterium]